MHGTGQPCITGRHFAHVLPQSTKLANVVGNIRKLLHVLKSYLKFAICDQNSFACMHAEKFEELEEGTHEVLITSNQQFYLFLARFLTSSSNQPTQILVVISVATILSSLKELVIRCNAVF